MIGTASSGGADTLDGGRGDDTLFGGAGADELDGGTGNDLVDGGTGDDLIEGGTGDDEVLGDSGDDTMIGGTGFDELHGGAGNDLIFNSDHGRLFGDEGADLLVGVGPGELLASGGDDVNDDDQIIDEEQSQSGMFFDGGDGFNQIFASDAGNSTILGGDDFDRIYVAGGTGNFVDAGTGSDSNDDIIDYGETTIYSGDGLDFYSLAADQTNLVSTLQDIDLEEDAIIILIDQSEIDLQPDRDDIIYGIDATGEYNTLSYTHTNGFVEVVAHIPTSIGTAEDIQNNLVIDFWPASIENPDSDLASAIASFTRPDVTVT